MKPKDWVRAAAGLAALALLAWSVAPRPTISFAELQDAKDRIQAAGFHCQADYASGKTVNGFMVSREEASWAELCGLVKAGKMTSAWKGKVSIRPFTPGNQVTVPDDAGVRVWGSVCAFGDADLLREIEWAL